MVFKTRENFSLFWRARRLQNGFFFFFLSRMVLQLIFCSFFPGPNTFEDGCLYIRRQFEAKNLNDEREIYVRLTCATDTQNINFLFNSVTDAIIANNLKGSELL